MGLPPGVLGQNLSMVDGEPGVGPRVHRCGAEERAGKKNQKNLDAADTVCAPFTDIETVLGIHGDADGRAKRAIEAGQAESEGGRASGRVRVS